MIYIYIYIILYIYIKYIILKYTYPIISSDMAMGQKIPVPSGTPVNMQQNKTKKTTNDYSHMVIIPKKDQKGIVPNRSVLTLSWVLQVLQGLPLPAPSDRDRTGHKAMHQAFAQEPRGVSESVEVLLLWSLGISLKAFFTNIFWGFFLRIPPRWDFCGDLLKECSWTFSVWSY